MELWADKLYWADTLYCLLWADTILLVLGRGRATEADLCPLADESAEHSGI